MAAVLEILLFSRLFIDLVSMESGWGIGWAVVAVLAYAVGKLKHRNINAFDRVVIAFVLAGTVSALANLTYAVETLSFTSKYIVPVMIGSLVADSGYQPTRLGNIAVAVYALLVAAMLLETFRASAFDLLFISENKNVLISNIHALSQGLVKVVLFALIARPVIRILRPEWMLFPLITVDILAPQVRSSILGLGGIYLILMFEGSRRMRVVLGLMIAILAVMFGGLIIESMVRFQNIGELTIDAFSAGRVAIWETYRQTMTLKNWFFGQGVVFLSSEETLLQLSLHNDILQFLFSYGIISMVILSTMLWRLVRQTPLSRRERRMFLIPALLMIMTNGMLFHQNTAFLFAALGLRLRAVSPTQVADTPAADSADYIKTS